MIKDAMHFWMDISRDSADVDEVLSVVAGCRLCGNRTLKTSIRDARNWITTHISNYHKEVASHRVEQIGDPVQVNQKMRPQAMKIPNPVKVPRSKPNRYRDSIQAMIEQHGPMTTDEVAEALECTRKAAYKQLARMKEAGYLTSRRRGRDAVWSGVEAPSEALEQPEATVTAPAEAKPAESLPRLLKPYYGDPKIVQGFGDHEEVYSRFGFKGHMGLDIGIYMQPVLAAQDGVVEFAGDGGEWPRMGSSAGTCILIKGDGLSTGYAHLDKTYVSTGMEVKAGDVIGISGSTGATTGYHLHFEVLPHPYVHGNGYAGRVDPTPYLVEGTPTLGYVEAGGSHE